MNAPLCRDEQFHRLFQAIDHDFRLILLTGPISSGKTTTVKSLFDQLKEREKAHEFSTLQFAHIYIDTGATIADALSEVAYQIGNITKRIRTFQLLDQVINDNNKKTLICFDSFDLLGDSIASALFTQAQAIVSSQLLPNFVFIFVSHVNPMYLTPLPLTFLNISFPAYKKEEIEEIVTSYYPDNEKLPTRLKKILDIVGSITTDIRDIIFIAHTISRFEELTQNELTQISIRTLNKMRSQQTCRINNLPTLSAFILLALYIGSKTSVQSDLMKFARALKKKRKKTSSLLEKNDTVPLERIIALTKALIYSHYDNKIDFDFAGFVQIQNLLELDLISIRGSLLGGDAKLVNLATDQEIYTLAQKYNIRIDEYVSENN